MTSQAAETESQYETVDRIRRSHAHARPRPNPAENPAWANCHMDCGILLKEIERLEYIQRDFHNVGDVAEIRRLRIAINNYVRARIEERGELAHYWWTLQEIAKEGGA